jgi:hypothetical protein
MCLKEKVMLVNLSISQWTARKYDKKVSKEVDDAHGAKDAGRYNKVLISDDLLKAIGKTAGSLRTYHYFNTLPWGDTGDRILPAENYFNYIGEVNKLKTEFEELVSSFVAVYPSLQQDAEQKLGTMFSLSDYPMPGLVAKKFGVKVGFMPISDSDDLRLQITDSEIEKIKSEINCEINNRVGFAVGEMLNRIKEAVAHMADKLSDKDAIFRDSLVENVCSLIETIPLLNFNKDAHVKEVVEMIEPLCCNPEQLRQNPAFRAEIAKKASEVLRKI